MGEDFKNTGYSTRMWSRWSHTKHACVLCCPAHPENPHAKTYFIKRPHGFSFTFRLPLTTGLFACSARAKTDERCFFFPPLLVVSTVHTKTNAVVMKSVFGTSARGWVQLLTNTSHREFLRWERLSRRDGSIPSLLSAKSKGASLAFFCCFFLK